MINRIWCIVLRFVPTWILISPAETLEILGLFPKRSGKFGCGIVWLADSFVLGATWLLVADSKSAGYQRRFGFIWLLNIRKIHSHNFMICQFSVYSMVNEIKLEGFATGSLTWFSCFGQLMNLCGIFSKCRISIRSSSVMRIVFFNSILVDSRRIIRT